MGSFLSVLTMSKNFKLFGQGKLTLSSYREIMDEMITDNPWALITDILMIYILKLPVKNKIHTIKKMKLFFIIRGSDFCLNLPSIIKFTLW